VTKIGILGGGQLGRMLALAGYRFGLEFRFFDTSPDACAGQAGELHVGDFADEAALRRFAEGLDAVTFEWENVPTPTAELLQTLPGAEALRVSQDRLIEKSTFGSLGIETARFAPFGPVPTPEGILRALRETGLPAIVKTRRGGYDGKGQAVVRSADELRAAVAELLPAPLILEGFVGFDRELSIIAARSTNGETVFYPLVQNTHRAGMLRLTRAPAPNLTPELQAAAEDIARRVLQHLDYAGVLAIELFEQDGKLLANEMAPRVHNSGHWSIDGATTSQFENHLRAVLGLPLGDTAASGASAMLNLIGAHPPLEAMLAIHGARAHLYGKSPRSGRKIGHVTLVAPDVESLERPLAELTALVDHYADG
jgi:5-(carboxyamino)imidazole ribonucleotide synthase